MLPAPRVRSTSRCCRWLRRSGWLVCGPGCSQGFAGVAAEVDKGERPSLAGQDLVDWGGGDFVSGIEDFYCIRQLVWPFHPLARSTSLMIGIALVAMPIVRSTK